MVHDVTVVGLTGELAAASAGALIVGFVVARARWSLFLGIVVASCGVLLPALLAAILLDGPVGTAALGIAMLPILAWGWRRMPPRQWRTARGLGASRWLVVRALIVPPLLAFVLAALVLGGAVIGLRWRLATHAAPLLLPDPVTATG